MADGTPRQIGRYQILGETGRGGFGRVYRALDPAVGRQVAIKILTEASKDVVTRFHKEARVAANLQHENIVTVYEYGDHDGKPFLAMEYLEGETIQQLIASHKPLSILEKCTIMSQVAEGLHYAHCRGIVHRDVKPANIMVLPGGTAKIMDFGIARVINDQSATRLTQEGSVVGTMAYMSPEQFGGIADVDALCDIFAFGVIWYEFLTGHHPFEATDARALMYKITAEEPPPIQNFIAEFPDSLQDVISRTLAKDRDLRYTSLKSVQFDLEPIRMQLQQQRASGLLVQAQELFEKGQLEPAQTAVLEVLTLDRANSSARALYDTVQRRLQQRTLQPRIEATLSAGEEHIERRRFVEAVKSFESALRLDRENAYIQDRLEYARGLLEHSKEAASLLAEARKQLTNENMTSAYRCVTEALRHDPLLPGAAELLKDVQQIIEVRQRKQRIEDALHKAEGLKLLCSYDAAVEVLTGLGPDVEDSKVQHVLTLIRAEKVEEERKRKLRNEMAAATDLLRDRQLVRAVDSLTGLKEEFPGNAEVSNLLSYAQKELEAETRATAIEKASTEAKSLIEEQRFDAALAVLDATLKSYPSESTLIRLLGSAIAAKADWEREQAVQNVIGRCDDLRSRQRFAEAIELVEAALRDYSAEPRLTDLLDRLEKQWDQQRRAQNVLKVAERVQKLLAEKQPERAVQVLQQTLTQYPDEPALCELLERANEEVRAQEKARFLGSIRQQASILVERNDFDQALEVLDKGLGNWPSEPVLVEERAQIAERKRVWERERAVRDTIARARQLQSGRKFAEAANLIDAARLEYSDDPALVQLADELNRVWEQHKREEAIREITSEARVLMSRNHPDEALDLLNEAILKYQGNQELESVAAQAGQAIEARERMLAIGVVRGHAKERALAHDFGGARLLLEQGLEKYSEDVGLARQLEELAAAERTWVHETAVNQALERATQFASGDQFEQALDALTAPLREYPNDPALVQAKRQLDSDFEQHKRRLAIARAVADATSLLDRGQLDEGLRLLRGAASRYPGEIAWPELIGRAESELAARKRLEERARAIAIIERDAKELAVQRRFEAASQMVAQGLASYPDDAKLTELQSWLRAALEQNKRAEAVQQGLAAATGLLNEGRLNEADQLLRKLGRDFPEEETFGTLLTLCEKRMEERRRRDETARQGEALIGDKRFQEAVELLDKALAGQPGDRLLTSLRDRAKKQWDEVRARQEGIRQAIEAIQSLGQNGQFAGALTKAQAAQKRYDDEPSLARLVDEMRMRKGLAEATTLLEQSRPEAAISLIQETASAFADLPEVAALIQRAREQQELLARAAAIDAEVKKVSERVDAGDLDQALALVEAGLRKWPEAASLIEVRKFVLAAKATRERQLAVEEAISQCEQLRQNNRPDTAMQFVQRLLNQFENEPALIQLRGRIESELRQREQRQKRERVLHEIRNIGGEVQRVSSPSDIAEMLASIRQIVAQHPDDDEIRKAAEAPLLHLALIDEARRKLAAGDFAGVLEIAESQLSLAPHHVLFLELKGEAERRQRLSYLQEAVRRTSSEPDLEKRVRMLEEALRLYPDEARIADELRLTRNKLSLVIATVEKARVAEKAGDWDGAWQQWNLLTTIHEQQPNLKSELERVQRAREQLRGEAIARWVQAIGEGLRTGDLNKAAESLRQARSEFPDAAELLALAKPLEDLRQKVARARELYSQARKALQTDWLKAERLVNEAAALQSGLTPPDDLLRAIGEKKREAEITALLASAGKLRNSGDVPGALAAVQRALGTYPDESRLKSLLEALQSELRRKHDALAGELQRIEQSGQIENDRARLEAMLGRASAIASENQLDQALSSLAGETVDRLSARIRQVRRAQLTRALVGQTKPISIAAATVIVLVAGWFGTKAVLRAMHEIPIKIAGSIPGIRIVVGGKQCVTPDCALSLKPGNYTLKAFKAGYKTVNSPVTVTSGQTEVDVPLALDALPDVLQVHTNFKKGSVQIDRRPLAALVEGEFSVSGLPPGAHTIRVSDGTAEFQAQWRTAVGEQPELTAPIVAKNVAATVIANTGATGVIACNCAREQVTVDGAPAGQASGTQSVIDHLAEGARQIRVGTRSVVMDVKPNPTLTVFLGIDRDVGALVIETGIENARVYLDGRQHEQTTGHDALRIQVDAGSHTIRIEKDGYRPMTPQPVSVVKGEERRMTFLMTPLPTSLEFAGLLPAAQVKIDGKVMGPTDSKGSFPVQYLTPGNHSIELSKDGYTSARVDKQLIAGKVSRIDGSQLSISKVVVMPTTAELEAQDWAKIRESKKPEDFDAFVQAYPDGSHARQAKELATQLRKEAAQAQQAKAERDTEAKAEQAWSRINQTNKAELESFISHFPGSPHVQEAGNAIAQLQSKQQKEDADRAERKLQAERQLAANKANALQQQAIIQALSNFEAAYNQRDLDKLRSIWTEMPSATAQAFRGQFHDAKDLTYQLRAVGSGKIDGDSADVDCSRTLNFTPKLGGGKQSRTDRVKVTLARTGSVWVIRSVTAY